MTFRPGANLDPGQVLDERGNSGGGRGGGFGFPGLGGGGSGGGIPVGGGIGGVIVLLVVVGAYLFLNGGLGGTSGTTVQNGPISSDLQQQCHTGADANSNEACRIVGYVNSVNAYWAQELPTFANKQY